MIHRTSNELGIAVGCVVFDMQLLGAALLIRTLGYTQPQRRRMRHPYRAAVEVMLLKSRVLLDFLAPKSRDKRDIQIQDFGLSPKVLSPPLDVFRDFVSKRSAHLTWERAQDPLPLWHEIHEVAQEACAFQILVASHDTVLDILAAGVAIVLPKHKSRYEEFHQQFAQLKPHYERQPQGEA